ncbi:MAG: DUF2948 family protein [Stellaceae bacterium]
MPPEGVPEALQLRAEDADDLAVISACLQDALVPVGDIAYVPQERSFLFVANRFRWEARRGGARVPENYERVLCAVAFDEIESVRYRGFRRDERGRILSLLAMRPEGAGANGAVRLDFADGATVRLATNRILCRLKDFGLPWPTSWRPGHDLGEGR